MFRPLPAPSGLRAKLDLMRLGDKHPGVSGDKHQQGLGEKHPVNTGLGGNLPGVSGGKHLTPLQAHGANPCQEEQAPPSWVEHSNPTFTAGTECGKAG